MPIAAWIVSALTAAFGFLVKHPFVLKMMYFTFFVLLVHRAIDYFLDFVRPYLQTIPFLNLLCYFGVISAINIFFSFLIAGFAVRQLLAFSRSS